MLTPVFAIALKDVLVLDKPAFRNALLDLSTEGRLVTLYHSPGNIPEEIFLTAVFLDACGKFSVRRKKLRKRDGFSSLTPLIPQLHIFEREITEATGAIAHGHPWLKPVRKMDKHYSFFKMEGKEIHEVGVGPVHAGVIEPGHFRFMCFGETVKHLEIQLGFQHRNLEALLLKRPSHLLAPLVESLTGDSSVAHGTAYAQGLEKLSGVEERSEGEEFTRAVALELERVAMHLVGLAGVATDIAYLLGASVYGRLRTAIINSSMRLCGSRFGRSWMRPYASPYPLAQDTAREIAQGLVKTRDDFRDISQVMFSARSVQKRLQGMGILPLKEATDLGVVGLAARSAGIKIDLRKILPGPIFSKFPISSFSHPQGDCFARISQRRDEVDASLSWLIEHLGSGDAGFRFNHSSANHRITKPPEPLSANMLVVSMVEGWRGEVVHVMETDASGVLTRYRLQDPSLRNWFGLSFVVRGEGISDFPICNKSFDLSYAGNDQ